MFSYVLCGFRICARTNIYVLRYNMEKKMDYLRTYCACTSWLKSSTQKYIRKKYLYSIPLCVIKTIEALKNCKGYNQQTSQWVLFCCFVSHVLIFTILLTKVAFINFPQLYLGQS